MHKRIAVVGGLLLLLISVVGVLIAQEAFYSTPLPDETTAAAGPREGGPRATPLAITPPHREISGDGKSPTISFIDNPSATCSRPNPGTGVCYIQWSYLNVEAASGSYIISMTVAIDDQIRAYHAGFFQTSMYIPSAMTAPGYQMTCGAPGSGGIDGWGRRYSYTIRARETSGLSSASYGSVTCPADIVQVFLPLATK